MEIKKVLWPTDFSGRAEAALAYVKSLTVKYQAEIHVLYVIEDIARHEGWYGVFDREHISRLLKKLETDAKKRLDKICTEHLEGCPLYVRHTAVGDPAQEILRFIHEENIDLVVMSSSGEKGNYKFGSVTEKILRHSPVPVVEIPVSGGTGEDRSDLGEPPG